MLTNSLQILSDITATLSKLFDPTQMIALVVVLLVAWLVQPLLRRAIRPLTERTKPSNWAYTLLIVLNRISLSLTALLLNQITTEVFRDLNDTPLYFLESATKIVGFWFIYRLLATLLEINISPQKARFWNRKVLLPTAMFIAGLSVVGLLDRVLTWGFYIESLGWTFTLGSALLAGIIVTVSIISARWVNRILGESFLPKTGVDPSIINIIQRLITYGLITVGVLIAMASMGINMTTLTVIAGGLSVGLAFGLQEIFNNFVSGFILLFERSLEPGDIVQIGENTGTVQQLGIRSTMIKTRDNVELIIPNSYFLTEVVTNMTRSEDLVRTRIKVGVTYNANPREVQEVLLNVARQHPNVLTEPPPAVQFQDFGDSSLDFILFIWTEHALRSPVLTSDLRYTIWDALTEHNIEIPFPQRDLHIRSGVPWDAPAAGQNRSK